jgi:hypothetical protein
MFNVDWMGRMKRRLMDCFCIHASTDGAAVFEDYSMADLDGEVDMKDIILYK